MSSTNEIAKEKAARLLKKGPGSVTSSSVSVERGGARQYRRAESVSTMSYEPQYGALRRPVRYENTYQLKPTKAFPCSQVERIVKDVVDSYLENEQYNPELCRHMTKTLSEVIRSRVKELMLPRYKIVCLVHMGQLANQGMRVASRCLWDATFDQFATYEFKNSTLFAICTVYGVYHD